MGESFEKLERFRIMTFLKIFQKYELGGYGKFIKIFIKSVKKYPIREAIFSFAGSILRCFTRMPYSGRTPSPYTVAAPSIFNPLEILKADWRNQQSNLFFIMAVNRARYAPSCRWLRPKYCSTI